MLLPALASAQPPADWRELGVVRDIRNWSFADYTRVVIYTDRRVAYTVRELPADPANGKPPRIYLDLKDARLAPELRKELAINDGLLRRARIAQFDRRTARLVLDVQRIARYHVVPFSGPPRIVIDVYGSDRKVQVPGPVVKNVPKQSKDPVADLLGGGAATPKVPRSTPQPAREKVIVVDAGHGGKDPGAIGYKGVYEKNIVLAVANRVAEMLRRKGHRVIQTRDKDVFLTLEERTVIANRERADLFVSIHANSAKNPAAHGIETYHLARASDQRSREVAARENASGGGDSDMDALEELLGALRLSNKLNVSSTVARFVQNNLKLLLAPRYRDVYRDLGVKGAPFYVLVGTDMASILIEIGFVTHPKESKLLQNSRYRDYLATGIVKGIEEYLEKLPKVPI